MAEELISRILDEINASTTTDHPDLIDAANELAAGVTGEREAEIAENLPAAYSRKVPARAQIDGDYLTVPKAVYVSASFVDGKWYTSTNGRKLNRPKMDCAVGTAVEFEGAGIVIMKIVILWRREK